MDIFIGNSFKASRHFYSTYQSLSSVVTQLWWGSDLHCIGSFYSDQVGAGVHSECRYRNLRWGSNKQHLVATMHFTVFLLTLCVFLSKCFAIDLFEKYFNVYDSTGIYSNIPDSKIIANTRSDSCKGIETSYSKAEQLRVQLLKALDFPSVRTKRCDV